ncbi:xanthine dehydrogenase family protein molybdopterin-binding subunit [Streptomyces sp. MNU89]|uniref:xanthine dehydrogenase family protein molybdopterin-binding subunit n=1 Tax=Streptomyces sp. MNU89 TaxID=2560025 RepID=UPI001E625A11|nr:xanthine dehydrogenase family protein molybdopterin-binding subunit [Streptomyces sp. MNU89]MCC9740864.1 xanthine dehydrogenase family protein molybdopterin-binding subunit [Streptomyces sp. MNU89]
MTDATGTAPDGQTRDSTQSRSSTHGRSSTPGGSGGEGPGAATGRRTAAAQHTAATPHTTASRPPAGKGGSGLGRPVDRVDGRLKVTGAARYGADHTAARLAHGHVVVSTVAHATIRSMDTRAARHSPGVLAVYTPFDPLKINRAGVLGPMRAPLQDKEVVHHGQPIGFVVAETFEQARDAAALIRVRYDERPAAVSLEDGLPGAREPAHVGGEPAVVTVLADGVASVGEALRDSEVRIEAAYTTAPQQHAPMEPHSAVAEWEDGKFTVHSSTQGVAMLAADLATALDADPADVRIVSRYVGGAFGGKFAAYAQTTLAAAAARDLGRPVKAVLTREQVFTATATRPGTLQTVALGARTDGTLTALRHHCTSGAPVGSETVEAGAHKTRTWYACPNSEAAARYVPLHIAEATIMRAPGEAPGSFALESALDELAVRLRIDPVELRIRNHAATEPGTGRPWSSKHLVECYRTGARRFGWHRRDARPRSGTDGDWYVGTGMATAVFPALRFPASMKVRFRADGTAEVSGSTADLGTGMWTVLSVVGAEALGIPAHRIKPDLGDSGLSPAGFVGASAGTSSVGAALLEAAGAAKKALTDLAVRHPRSPFRGRDPEDVRYERGRLTAPGGPDEDFGSLIAATGRTGVEAEGSSAPGEETRRHAFASFGAQFCEVRVHRRTAEIRVFRMLAVMDTGTVVNAKTARSQIMGGMVWGLSAALHEGLHPDDRGRYAGANLADYLLPVNADVPEVEVVFLGHPDTLHNRLGARGVGEIGVVGTAAAVANAVHHATGKRIRDLPITLDRLLE